MRITGNCTRNDGRSHALILMSSVEHIAKPIARAINIYRSVPGMSWTCARGAISRGISSGLPSRAFKTRTASRFTGSAICGAAISGMTGRAAGRPRSPQGPVRSSVSPGVPMRRVRQAGPDMKREQPVRNDRKQADDVDQDAHGYLHGRGS